VDVAKALLARTMVAVFGLVGASAAFAAGGSSMSLDPARPNAVVFEPVEAKCVRLVVHKTHSAQPCIDELEIYGPAGEANLASSSGGAKATASSCLEGHPEHAVAHLNDGRFGNTYSWISREAAGWAQIELPKPTLVNRVVFSRDRTGAYGDRMPMAFEVQVSGDGASWRTVKAVGNTYVPVLERMLLLPNRPIALDLPAQEAKYVRLAIRQTNGGEACVDEIEVYGLDGKTNLALASAGAKASASSCLAGFAIHRVEHLNDGKYTNDRSWIAESGPAWAQIELPRTAAVGRVVFSRDRGGAFRDRLATDFEVQLSLDGQQWNTTKKVAALEGLRLDEPAPGETPQDWAYRISTALSGPMHKTAALQLAKVRSAEDARAMLDLLRLDHQRQWMQQRLALEFNPAAIRRAVADLAASYPGRYRLPEGFFEKLAACERRLPQLGRMLQTGDAPQLREAMAQCEEMLALQRAALLANPLLSFDEVLVLKRKTPAVDHRDTYWQWGQKYGMTVNWSCDFRPKNPPIAPWWEDEIAAFPVRDGRSPPRTLFKPAPTHMLQHPELSFDAERLLFSMPGDNGAFQVFEVRTDGSGLRQVTRDTGPDIDNGDPCYLPDGRIVFNSTRSFIGVPCEDGQSYVSSLCLTDAEGRRTRMLTFDQESNWYPSLLNDGRVLYTRYEYANVSHQFGRLLFHMNPDGTSQMEYYGSNSYWPNSIFYARAIPHHPTKVVGVVCGHHGPNRTGRLVLLDPARGRSETSGAVQTIPGYGKPVERIVEDTLYEGDWPKFVHPWPLSEKYFLVAARLHPTQVEYGIYLVDVFDNMTEICRAADYSLLEPIPLTKRRVPPAIPDRIRPEASEATVYMSNVHHGPGLQGMPPGKVKKLRLFTYNYVYRHTVQRGFGHLATPGVDGPWEPRYLLGTVPVSEDGSAVFKVPANVPISVQPLDGRGRALQQMRSWFTAMPGETLSCVGCHEQQNTAPPPLYSAAPSRPPAGIEPWRGPARGFDYAREVQPVLDRYCVGCHDGRQPGRPDLARKSEEEKLRINRDYHQATESSITTVLTPSFIALHPYVRRPHAESCYGAQVAGEYMADTSPLVQMLQKGHHNVRLDDEAWDRLYTWIDLGAPDHGSWKNSEWGVPGNFYERRLEMLRQYANRTDDVEWVPPPSKEIPKFVAPPPVKPAPPPSCAGWPFDVAEAQRRQAAAGLPKTITLEAGKGLPLELVLIPAGEFLMGDPNGAPDERAAPARVPKPFYMARCEVTNAQFAALVDPAHSSGFVGWMSIDWRGEGYPLFRPAQPVVRVSWLEAIEFCKALSARTGKRVTLPSEAQWEWACRAGSHTPLWYGGPNDDFSAFENLAGREMRSLAFGGKPKWFLRDDRFDDRAPITTAVGSYRPNAWGLCDMAGNVSEWTRSTYRPQPSDPDSVPDDLAPESEKVVRGGSWCAIPRQAGSAWRWRYPAWRKVHNVGFRPIVEVD
jgi:formylglycine-generating enzyme required for sulfatase activity